MRSNSCIEKNAPGWQHHPEILKNDMNVNNREFEIIRLLGKGKGGYSYLASDGEGLFVIKQIHHEPCDYYQFGNKLEAELRDYERLRETGIPLPKLLDVDRENERILKEYIDGDTVFDCVKNDCMSDDYLSQMRKMCAVLYPRGINIDYFPTNFIVRGGELWYIDYECNNYMDEWNFENWGIKYWSKSPEFMEYLSRL